MDKGKDKMRESAKQLERVESDNKSEKSRLSRVVNKVIRRTFAIAFSQTGIMFIVMLYILGGGAMFQMVEQPWEKIEKRNARQFLIDFAKQCRDYISKLNHEIPEYTPLRRKNNLYVCLTLVLKVYDTNDWPLHHHEPDGQTWGIANSFFYSVTLVTSIGYGSITCKTLFGRLATVAYGLLGLPLFFLCLTNIGGILSHLFAISYETVCKKFVIGSRRKKMAALAESMREKGKRSKAANNNNSNNCRYRTKAKRIYNFNQNNESAIVGEEQEVPMPVTVTVLSIVAYLWGGALLFMYWEDWDMITALYFCFISISSIGFGDIMPGVGSGRRNVMSDHKTVFLALWLLFGLTLVTMSIGLVQQAIREKFEKGMQGLSKMKKKK